MDSREAGETVRCSEDCGLDLVAMVGLRFGARALGVVTTVGGSEGFSLGPGIGADAGVGLVAIVGHSEECGMGYAAMTGCSEGRGLGFVATDGCDEGLDLGARAVRLGDSRESASTEGRGGTVGMGWSAGGLGDSRAQRMRRRGSGAA